MIEWFLSGGVIMWPLLIVAIGVVGLAIRAALRLRSSTSPGRSLNSILFWGGMAALLGALGTAVGIVIMARNISAAGEVSAGLVWGGVGVSLVSLVFGIAVFLVAGLLWLALDAWRARAMAEGAGARSSPA